MTNTKQPIIAIESGYWGGYNIVEKGKTPSGKNYKQLVASGFSTLQKAVDYARLARYNANLSNDYAFTEQEKTTLQNINAAVANEFCSWLGFVENVCNDSQGLAGLLSMIHSNKTIQQIVNNYI